MWNWDEHLKKLYPGRISATKARHCYKLTDSDLSELKDVLTVENPVYPTSYPMRLYRIQDCQALLDKKNEQWEAGAEERAAKHAAKAEAIKKRKMAALATVQGFAPTGRKRLTSSSSNKSARGENQLQVAALELVMEVLVAQLEPGGVVGPSAVAGWISRAALVCWDMFIAAQYGYSLLEDAVAKLKQRTPHWKSHSPRRQQLVARLAHLPGPPDVGGWPLWEALVRRPMSLTLLQLKTAARFLCIANIGGTKPELILRLLPKLGLKNPTSIPSVKLLAVLALERSSELVWDGPGSSWAVLTDLRHLRDSPDKRLMALAENVQGLQCVARLRSSLIRAGVANMAQLHALAQQTRRHGKEM